MLLEISGFCVKRQTYSNQSGDFKFRIHNFEFFKFGIFQLISNAKTAKLKVRKFPSQLNRIIFVDSSKFQTLQFARFKALQSAGLPAQFEAELNSILKFALVILNNG